MKFEHTGLLIDRYMSGVAPNADALGKSFGLPVLTTLPPSPELRINAKNQATTLFDLAPREALSQALKNSVNGWSCVHRCLSKRLPNRVPG